MYVEHLGDDLAKLTSLGYWGDDLAKLIIFRYWGEISSFGKFLHFHETYRGNAARLFGKIHPPIPPLDLHPC